MPARPVVPCGRSSELSTTLLALSALSALLIALTGCTVAQPDGFCDESADCGEGRVCNAHSRTCQLDVSQPIDGYDMWGSFTCLERDQIDDAQGAMVLGMTPSITRALGLEIAEGYVVGYYALRCGLGRSGTTSRWILGTSVKTKSGVNYVIQLFIDNQNLRTDGVQRGTSGNGVGIGIAKTPSNTVALTSRDIEIRIDERYESTKPRGARGEFRARGLRR